jgi:hypothetical protein
MAGSGASPEGNRPFLDLLDIDSGETTRLWQSAPPFLESVGSIMSDGDHVSLCFCCCWCWCWCCCCWCCCARKLLCIIIFCCLVIAATLATPATLQDAPITLDGLQLLLSRESAAEPPQTYLVSFSGTGADAARTERRITDFPHPYPQLKDMQKEVLRYKRDDGVDLTGTLYLPPGYDTSRDGPLPTLLWAYPREYKSKVRVEMMHHSCMYVDVCVCPAVYYRLDYDTRFIIIYLYVCISVYVSDM